MTIHAPMKPIRLLLAALLTMLGTTTAFAQDAAANGPNPQLEPPQVVQAMLSALKKNSDAGIAELYRFSSPRNREQTGPLEQFTLLIREGFADMLGHRSAKIAPPLIDGERAMLPVEIVSSQGDVRHYIFLLSRQSIPECQGCWMADAVFNPEGEDATPGPKHEYPT